jgi:stage II sporulation protein D
MTGRLLATGLLAVLLLQGRAETLRIGLFYGQRVTGIDLVVAGGRYHLVLPGSRQKELSVGSSVTVEAAGESCLLTEGNRRIGTVKKVRLVAPLEGTMRLRWRNGSPQQFTYGGHFEITAAGGKLRVVNTVETEAYVAAVVESEAGDNHELEFLKVQAILCRTYAYGHLQRHAGDGFQLCDQVHCQSYKGKSRFNSDVETAVAATRGRVLTDSLFHLIIAAYHSNCGGQTLSADSVWSRHVDYLQPVTDTFCLGGKHARWEQTISLQSWAGYLRKKGMAIASDSLLAAEQYCYSPYGRNSAFRFNGKSIPLKVIREDWKMNSTWFCIDIVGDSLQFTGQGFGHGIGLCQEGAMHMAALGWPASDILAFYYSGVREADADAIRLLQEK